MIDKWDDISAGGCSTDISFFQNPMFKIQTETPVKVRIELESKDCYAVGLSVFNGNQIPDNIENIKMT